MTKTIRGEAAREAMLDAAEEIACEIGIGAITLTGVQQRSGQANKSAAAYHFGSRHGLLLAVVARRMGPVDQRRREILATLEEETQDLVALTGALVRPLAEATVLNPGSRYARFLAQAFIDPQLSELVLGHPEASGFREVRERIHTVLSEQLPPDLADARIASALGLQITTCSLHEGHPTWNVGPAFADDLVAMCLAVLTTPLTA